MEGLIYKVLDYKESSNLVYLYTNFGLDSLLVRGSKKYKSENLSFCEYLNYVSYTKTNNTLPTLIDYKMINRFINIKNSITKLKYASIITEVLRQVLDQRHSRILNFTIKILEKMEANDDPISLTFIYLVKMLKVFGILPDLDKPVSNDQNFNDIFIKAYYTLDYDIVVNKEYIKKIIDYYNKYEALNCFNIYKILEV